MNTMERLMNRYRVRVLRTELDDRVSLCGEPLQTGPEFGEFGGFDIPAHQADYIKATFPKYKVSDEPFDPQQGKVPRETVKELMDKAKGDESGQPMEEGSAEEKKYPCKHEGCNYVAETPIKLATHVRTEHK